MKDIDHRLRTLETVWKRPDPPAGVPGVDPARLTPAEKEEAGRLRAIILAEGVDALSDADLALAECLRRKLAGDDMGACCEIVATSPNIRTDPRIWPR